MKLAAATRGVRDLRLAVLLIFCCFTLAAASPASAATPAHFWSQGFGSTLADEGFAVVVDGSGNVLVTGKFTGTVNFGGGNLVSAGSYDIFVAKYNSAGVHQWSQRFGNASGEEARAVAVDGSGSVLVAGYFIGTVNFGGANLVSAGGTDIFVAKYNSAGAHQWSQRFGGTAVETATDVEVDGSGNVLVTGAFQGTVDFGGGNLVSSGINDVFLAKYNSAGVHLWSQRFGSTVSDSAADAAADGSGNVLITGQFQGTVNFGGANLVSSGNIDIFVAKYNSAGVHQWSQRFGSTAEDIGRAIAVDGTGSVLLTGYFPGTVDFGGGGLVSAGDVDIFVAKLSSTGVHQWSQRFGSAGSDAGSDVAVDGSGSVLVMGGFSGTVDFGGGNLVSSGINDVFLAKYNSAGVHQWSQRFGGTSSEVANAVAVDGSDNVLITGYFFSTADFGGGNLVSAGQSDIYLAKYAANSGEPVISSIADIGNDQGRKVRIRFARSGHDDAQSGTSIEKYTAFRRDDAPPMAVADERPASLSDARLLADGWTQVGVVDAYGESSYGIDVPTVGDSTVTLGQYYSAFFIRAATDVQTVFYDSPSDSGYSLDNLVPSAPTNFVFETGELTWDESTAADFDFFTIYGSNTNSFGSATLIDYTVDPAMDVNASPYTFYFVTATDFSGNEGKPTVINALSGIGEGPRSYILSVSAYPNPFNPQTTIRYTLPSRGHVTIAIHDARGARVATLLDGEKAAGSYTLAWNGTNDGGVVASSGVYFAKIAFGDQHRAYKLVLLK